MILEIDMGNTRLKWRLKSRATRLDAGYLEAGASYDALYDALGVHFSGVSRVLVASVRAMEEDQAFAAWVKENLALEAEFARSTVVCGLVTNGYASPQQLGVDRWLAILAGYHCVRRSCVIISAGTALTVDLVAGDGRHLGGYIAPGVGLFRATLQQSTARIKLGGHEAGVQELTPGDTTAAAISNACAAMIRGIVDNALAQIKLVDQCKQVELLLTGGDAQRIKSLYSWAEYKQELVLDGLSYVFDLQSIK